jgi:hypothetical protein
MPEVTEQPGRPAEQLVAPKQGKIDCPWLGPRWGGLVTGARPSASFADRLVQDISFAHRSYISSCGRDRPAFDRA